MNNNKKQNPTYLYALGGLEEIGKNTYVIEQDDQIIVVDAGIKFAPDDMLGINGMVANYQTLIDNQSKISALVITHGHEDHIGGIPYLLKHVPIKKIIAPSFAVKLICKKLNEFKGLKLPEFIEVTDDDNKFSLGSIDIEFIRVCHSIPDAYSVYFKTPNGTIFESGDFRFDLGLGRSETNFGQLLDVRSQNLDVLLCESTNAEIPGFSESETVIFNNLYNIIKEAPGRVFLSTFASNINRIQKVVEMALEFNRKICVIGKSMDTNIKISKKMKLVDLIDSDLIKPADIKKYQDNEVLVLLTGSQGEEMAALNVMARGKHPKVILKKSDTVILSSNPIPGNFASVEFMVDKLYKLGVTVIENTPNLKIHASGHATMQELQLLMHLLEPRYIFPIHGEYKMMRQMQKLAMGAGLEKDKVIISTNGHKLQLLNHELSLTDIDVPGDPMYINGKDIKTDSSALLNERRILSNEGIIELAICYSKKNKRITNIEIATRGCFIAKNKMPLLKKLKAVLIDNLTTEINLHPEDSVENLTNYAKSITKSTIWKSCHKNPLIFITFLDYDFICQQMVEGHYLNKTPKKVPGAVETKPAPSAEASEASVEDNEDMVVNNDCCAEIDLALVSKDEASSSAKSSSNDKRDHKNAKNRKNFKKNFNNKKPYHKHKYNNNNSNNTNNPNNPTNSNSTSTNHRNHSNHRNNNRKNSNSHHHQETQATNK